MWRIFGCTGGATEDVVIAAFNMAYEAGVDLISASLGERNGWPASEYYCFRSFNYSY